MLKTNNHSFHIPVLGTGYSIDSPLKVAKFGISSVVSLVDDNLIEQMRKHLSLENGLEFSPIEINNEDSRALRITSYLNLLDILIKKQVEDLKTSALLPDSDSAKYFELLPNGALKDLYNKYLDLEEGSEKDDLELKLKKNIVAGSIDVNIMTKLDRIPTRNGKELSEYYSDATTALRGYANSTLNSSIVFSAGMNPRLFGTMSEYKDFYPDENGYIKKKIILKVSDFRSAQIQGMILTKKSLWISEFRIESGLNCGGHAFATKGNLIGPILNEFRSKRDDLSKRQLDIYKKSCDPSQNLLDSLKIRITVQGGIGTSVEHDFMQDQYNVDSIGWGTPFMLVPEVINIDDEHLNKLSEAGADQVFLSNASPLGVLFWNLRDSASEIFRKLNIDNGTPGVAICRKGYLALNTEFTKKPICAATRAFQKLELDSIKSKNLPENSYKKLKEKILAKACICNDLAASVTKKLNIDPEGKTCVTPGPNIVNFTKISTLREMVDHIYGKINLLNSKNRPHVFIRELQLYRDFLISEIENKNLGIGIQRKKYFEDFYKNLEFGINYYRDISIKFREEHREDFITGLEKVQQQIKNLLPKIELFSE